MVWMVGPPGGPTIQHGLIEEEHYNHTVQLVLNAILYQVAI